MNGYLVLDDNSVFEGVWLGGRPRVGEVVFNTSHSGYEEMATDPSYYNQILVTTTPMQGNYGASQDFWESKRLHISGFVCVEMQNSKRDKSWLQTLVTNEVPVLENVDTRRLVVKLRSSGTPLGAIVQAPDQQMAITDARKMIDQFRSNLTEMDWCYLTSRTSVEFRDGQVPSGPRVAVLDFGTKENILREFSKRCSKLAIFPSRTSPQEIRNFDPQGIVLTNGPGDPKDVKVAVETVKSLLGWRPIFGICMGLQILALSLGAQTYKLKFGHRGANHPIDDKILKQIYMSSQNHGYAVDPATLPSGVEVSHVNLYDNSVAGLQSINKKCFGVQFHPENSPGPREALALFDYFVKTLI